MEGNKKEDYNGKKDDNVCRDFLRNVCRRGSRCKFRHPDGAEAQKFVTDMIFCHDYQLGKCHRMHCRYLHCTKDEEDYFHSRGELPDNVRLEAESGGCGSESLIPMMQGKAPVCKDFLKGECNRGEKCKYLHVMQRNSGDHNESIWRQDRRSPPGRSYRAPILQDDLRGAYGSSDYHILAKRRRLDGDPFDDMRNSRYQVPIVDYKIMEDENLVLRQRIQELKKQVADLTATNEVLLDQNARLRTNKITADHFSQFRSLLGNSSSVVSVTPSMTPIVTPAIVTPAAQNALNALTSNLSQQIALNSELATQQAQALQQRLNDLGVQQLNPPASLAIGNMTQVDSASQQVSLQQSIPSVSLAVSMPGPIGQQAPNVSMATNLSQYGPPLSSDGRVSYPSQNYSQRSLAHQ